MLYWPGLIVTAQCEKKLLHGHLITMCSSLWREWGRLTPSLHASSSLDFKDFDTTRRQYGARHRTRGTGVPRHGENHQRYSGLTRVNNICSNNSSDDFFSKIFLRPFRVKLWCQVKCGITKWNRSPAIFSWLIKFSVTIVTFPPPTITNRN